MSTALLHLADWALVAFHTALVAFNCTGWIWERTRRLHLATLAATLASWVVLSPWFGLGYCVCTDLQWKVKAALGERLTEDTYIQFLTRRLTGWTPPAATASDAAAIVLGATAVLSIWLNIRDWKRRRRFVEAC